MKELEDLKSIWKAQEPEKNNSGSVDFANLLEKIDRQRIRIFRTNLIGSICMVLTIAFLFFLMIKYANQSFLFHLSVSLIIVVMVIANVILWSRVLVSRKKLDLDTYTYIQLQLSKLRRNKTIIQYSPLYGFVLGILVNAYAYSLVEDASSELVFWVTNANWIYAILISAISYRYKMKKFTRSLEPLMLELEKLKEGMTNGKPSGK